MRGTLSITVFVLAVFAIKNTEAFDRLHRPLKVKDLKVHPVVASRSQAIRDYDEVTFNNWRCNDWYSMDLSFEKCLNVTDTGLPLTKDVLFSLQYLCSEQNAVTRCMEKVFEDCDDIPELESMLKTSFSFCVGNSFPDVMKIFLVLHSGINVTQECLMSAIMDFQEYSLNSCTPSKLEKKETLSGELEYWDSLIGWYVSCAFSQSLDVYLDTCDVTRRQIYAIIIASLQITFGFGMNHYPKFEALMQSNTQKYSTGTIIPTKSLLNTPINLILSSTASFSLDQSKILMYGNALS